MLRAAVGGIAGGFGHAYYLAQGRSGGKTDELWGALADGGFVGVNIPAEYGGGGQGLAELALVCEECAAAGVPLLLLLVSPAICGSILARFGTAEQKRAVAPRPRVGPGQDGLRHYRARRRLEQSPHLDGGPPRRGGLRAVGDEVLHLGRGRGRDDAGGDPHRNRRPHRSGTPLALRGRHRRPRSRPPGHPGRGGRARAAVHPLLRRRGRRVRPADRRRGVGALGPVRRAQPRADPVGRPVQRCGPLRPREGRPLRPGAGRLGRHRSGPTRAWPTPWPRRPSTSSWPGS